MKIYVDTDRLSDRFKKGIDARNKVIRDTESLMTHIEEFSSLLNERGEAVEAVRIRESAEKLKNIIRDMTDVTGFDRYALTRYGALESRIEDLISGTDM